MSTSKVTAPYAKKLTPKKDQVDRQPMADNTVGPSMPGTEQVEAGPTPRDGSQPYPQLDYRANPSLGQTPTSTGAVPGATDLDNPSIALRAPTYDSLEGDSPTVAPQPDSAIRSYDLDDKSYNIMDPNQGDRYDPRPAGYSPDLPAQTAWERSPGGPTGMDGMGCVPADQVSLP